MTAAEIVTRYEALWRALDRDGTPQMYGIGGGGSPREFGPPGETCAWIAGYRDVPAMRAAQETFRAWRCPEPRCRWDALGLAGAMIHLNNAHRWTWREFADGFRAAWARGVA